jgi:hypothetical protein
MWPPPAPPQRFDRSELPANLRPSNLPRPSDWQRSEGGREGTDDADAAPAASQRPRSGDAGDELRSDDLVAGVQRSSSRDQNESKLTSDDERPGTAPPGDGVSNKAARRSSVEPATPGTEDVSSPTRSASVREGGGDLTDQVGQCPADVEAARQVRSAEFHTATDVTPSETDLIRSVRENPDEYRGYEEPMVIEFIRTGARDVSLVRAGHKRARANSGSSQTEIIKQSYVRQPVTFYGRYFKQVFVLLVIQYS